MQAKLTFWYDMNKFGLSENQLYKLNKGAWKDKETRDDFLKEVTQWQTKPFPRSPNFMFWSTSRKCFGICDANGKLFDYVPGVGFPLPRFMDPLEEFPVQSIDARIYFQSRHDFDLGTGLKMVEFQRICGTLNWEQIRDYPHGRYVLDVVHAQSLRQLSHFASDVRSKNCRPEVVWY